MESGARNIVANSAGRSRFRWRAVRTTLARTCWVSAPLRVRYAAAHLADDERAGWLVRRCQLVASTDAVPQEREDGGEFAGQMGGKARVVQRRRVVDQPADPGEQSAAGGSQTLVRSDRRRRAGRAARDRPASSSTWPAHGLWG